MDYDITPEPTAAERAALIAALERFLSAEEQPLPARRAYLSEWRKAGLAENVDPDGGADPRLP